MIRFASLGVIVAACLAVGVASAQEPPSVTPASLQKLVRDAGMKATDTEFGVRVMLKGKTVELFLFDEGRVLVAQCALFPKRPLEVVNRWNEQKALSRAIADKVTTRLEADLDCSLGLDGPRLAAFVKRYEKSLGDFDDYIARNGTRTGLNQVQTMQFGFPLGAPPEKQETAWFVRYVSDVRHGLRIESAWFKREKQPWLKVLGDVRVSQIYVPYQNNADRFFDIGSPGHAPWSLLQIVGDEKNVFGPFGTLVDPYVVREDRDAGLLYFFSDVHFEMGKSDGGERRGTTRASRRQEVLLWGVLQASNYFYVMQYGFQNDGAIVCKLGSTGKNLHPHQNQGTGHMHSACWRIDVDLGGSGPDERDVRNQPNEAYVVKHIEPVPEDPAKSKTEEIRLTEAQGIKWVAEEFTSLRIRSPRDLNALGRPVAYDLVPLRYGNARHFVPGAKGSADEFTLNDLWVTPFDAKQWDYPKLPKYVAGKSPLGDNVVAWHMSSNLHVPRDEDFLGAERTTKNQKGVERQERSPGCAVAMWSGFELRPRNVFANTPLIPTKGLPIPPPKAMKDHE
ncbi:MAG: hypothetical protein K2X38_16365 [Gemmataceae bacterium]|nr:hypothetical protein [Gemmataceae bacterium]